MALNVGSRNSREACNNDQLVGIIIRCDTAIYDDCSSFILQDVNNQAQNHLDCAIETRYLMVQSADQATCLSICTIAATATAAADPFVQPLSL
jgi:hypothetical protein